MKTLLMNKTINSDKDIFCKIDKGYTSIENFILVQNYKLVKPLYEENCQFLSMFAYNN